MNPQTIRLIDDSNKQIGIFSYEEALEKAKEKGLDLLVITLKTDPPVYKLGNYEKVRYRKGKEIKKEKLKIRQSFPKSIRIGFSEGNHDIETKAKKTEEFLEEDKIVIIQMPLKGREKIHFDLGEKKIKEFLTKIKIPYRIIQPVKRNPFGLSLSLKKSKES
ncbi:MAG: translation initiation factor IF-3 [Candidatus Paceibacterota bacterium]|mgnify:CR=1 FL=1|jgi:translation initiation factor IF-3|nr:translation initiation factor IF-3 [Candidatus Paceibacterota bacterium]MDD3548637.1 translation initiation factor IF-3 [Candidatus Paceibacterota bacterium]MDD4999137.1 translation initiation factor IF-3 [Candidatus Paceibacterota bacterium]MDD5545285.1 translation initiation factor IF-3 [Candidatus Paceibacterota bacterium]